MTEKEDIEKFINQKLEQLKNELLTAFIQKDEADELLDVSAVSQILNVTKKTVRKYYNEGFLRGEKNFANRIQFRKSDVKKFIIHIREIRYGIKRS